MQIIIDENRSVGNRLGFYENVGVIRDMVQNHILQVLTHLTIAEPTSFDQKEISFEKMKILRSIRPIEEFAIGQYKSLHEEAKQDISTQTAIGLKMFVDTFEFSGVPIYVRTGKKLPTNKSIVYIEFKNHSCKHERCENIRSNAMIIEIQPNMSINIRLNMKTPKISWGVNEVKFNFDHYKTFKINTPEAYEQMIEKIIHGDKTLFPCETEILESWNIIDPLIEKTKTTTLEIYTDHTIPKGIKELIEKDGRMWFEET
jgi:glucose-6-phosphate 1-dehydrogenase